MDIFSQIEAAARDTSYARGKPPTQAQAEANNYRKGRVTVHGLKIAIETPRNQYREGVSPDGEAWRTRAAAHYGHFMAKGADGDGVDVFIGPVPESLSVWVINQVGEKTRAFDEHKCLVGFADLESAKLAYLNSYEKGWRGIGNIVPCTVGQLSWWLKYGNKTIPLKASALPFDARNEIDDMTQVAWDSAANPVGTDLAGLIYQIRREDSDGLMFDAATVEFIMDGSESAALDALVVEYAKVERKMTQLQAVMGAASASVTPVAMQVTPPFKQRGTTQVASIFELSDGQTVTVFMHNPDLTPKKIAPQDELISWKWMLNKKDITILVAPEKGIDLNVREVARRIMRLAEKNSAKFQQANAARAGKLAAVEAMKSEAEAKAAALEGLNAEIADLTVKVEAKRAAKPAAKASEVIDPTAPEGYAKLSDEGRLEAYQDQLDSLFQGRLIEVRNALRGFGWDGAKYKPLSKDGFTLKPVYQQVGAGANIVNISYEVDGLPGFFMSDSLTREPSEIASLINGAVDAKAAKGGDIAKVDAAYKFASATDDFKRFVAASVAETDYSPFASAMRMDQRAEANNARIEWGSYGSGSNRGDKWVGNVVQNGKLIGRVDMGGDGKAMVYLGVSGDARVEYAPGKTYMYSDDDAPDMIDSLFAMLKSGESVAPTVTAEDLAAQLFPNLNSVEKSAIDNGYIPNSVLEASKAAGISNKDMLDALRALNYDASDSAEQAKFAKFDMSLIKMPTAKQLGMGGAGKVYTFTYDGADGWSSGHLLDLKGVPKVARDGIEKYYGGTDGTKRLTQENVARVLVNPRSATTEVLPVAFYDGDGSGKNVQIVFAADDDTMEVSLNRAYASYFMRTFKGAKFFANDPNGGVLVKHGGDIVGVVMPLRFSNSLIPRARKAASGESSAIPKAADKLSRIEWEEAVYRAIENTGMTRSDAQSVADARGTMLDEQFAAGATPADAAAALLMAPAVAMGSDTPAIEEFRHEGFRVYPVKMRDGWRIAVQSIDNLKREQAGDRQVGGDAVVSTIEQAKSQAEFQVREAADQAARDAEIERQKAESDAAEAARIAMFADFVAYKGYSAPAAENARTALLKEVRYEGQVMTIKALVEAKIAEGYRVTDEDGMRGLEHPDGRYLKQSAITKTGLDYADWLASNQSAPAPANDALTEAKAYLQSVIDGGVDYFDTGLADKLGALYEAHNGDADFDALFERAATAYSDAMIAAAKKAMG